MFDRTTVESQRVLYRARHVLPVDAPIIEDGAVLAKKGVIVAVGRYRDLVPDSGGASVQEFDDAVILPALVNAHVHLELSHLSALGSTAPRKGLPMTGWIEELLDSRAGNDDVEDQQQAVDKALRELHDSGCGLVADIGNLPASSRIVKGCGGIHVLFLLEMLGISRESEDGALVRLRETPPDVNCTAHAPYSTGRRLLLALKERALTHGHLFSVHVAESVEEGEFLRSGTGPFRDFFEKRGLWDGAFQPPGMSSIRYLDSLGVLDQRTLCVHMVHVEDADIDILAGSGAHVCLCPGSNRHLGVGLAPLEKMLDRGLLPALGTDSLASNSELNLWREMKILASSHPGVDPHTIFSMATRGGSLALKMDSMHGTLAVGKSADMIAVQTDGIDAADICDMLVNCGKNPKLIRVQ